MYIYARSSQIAEMTLSYTQQTLSHKVLRTLTSKNYSRLASALETRYHDIGHSARLTPTKRDSMERFGPSRYSRESHLARSSWDPLRLACLMHSTQPLNARDMNLNLTLWPPLSIPLFIATCMPRKTTSMMISKLCQRFLLDFHPTQSECGDGTKTRQHSWTE
jgi:hypothetical protein